MTEISNNYKRSNENDQKQEDISVIKINPVTLVEQIQILPSDSRAKGNEGLIFILFVLEHFSHEPLI